ncbi:hypothetical protein [Paenibacillus xylaniclasticus]|uniref:hypothetical protein n=1 Tax=Paenibacillus xylaniclasticus TaxID=588083 RepID=UPI000FD873D1|nr:MULTISPECIES: hypothetical protein [Paenibacillus]GFN32606.1 hypothetical protein PCURB6_28660 [Paenibacillus curdlanolyticus]
MQEQKSILTNNIINNILTFLNRVDAKGFNEAYALLEIKQVLELLANDQQTIQTSSAVELEK